MAAELVLYDYWRSSAAYRARIALNLKGLAYKSVPIHLAKGEQHEEKYKALNPQGAVPMLVADGNRITQSLAIMEYLDEVYPPPALLPADSLPRARARAFALAVACEMHPMNNLRTLKYLTGPLGRSEDEKNAWYAHWIREGFAPLEKMAQEHGNGKFAVGDKPSMADCCLIPQLYNARRFKCPLDAYPTLVSIDAHCSTLPAFEKAKPENQPGAE
jgi:maleylacetoacetate isomerase